MKPSEKIKGIVFAYNTTGEYDMVRELGVEWLRINISFPWKDKMFGELTEEYKAQRDEIRRVHAAGFNIMPATPPLGGFVYDKEQDATVWKEHFPAFCGEKGSEEFCENISRATQFICEDLGESAGMYWQVMNEPDIPTFSNDYSNEIIGLTARAQAKGIMRANPNARCGINISGYSANALEVLDAIYTPGHQFYYVGVDQYFGSWQPGDVDNWTAVIDSLYLRYGIPVLANEWGYSSGGDYQAERIDPKLLPPGLPDVCFAKKWFNQVEGGHTPEVQADYFRRGLKLFAEHPNCIGSFMFCWRDAWHCYHCGAGDCPSEDFWGLVTTDCRPKPAYYAVKEALAEYYK